MAIEYALNASVFKMAYWYLLDKDNHVGFGDIYNKAEWTRKKELGNDSEFPLEITSHLGIGMAFTFQFPFVDDSLKVVYPARSTEDMPESFFPLARKDLPTGFNLVEKAVDGFEWNFYEFMKGNIQSA